MFQEIMQKTFLQNRILDYVIGLAIFLIGMLVVRIFKSIFLRCFKAWAKKTTTTIDDFLIGIFEKTLVPLFYFGAFYLGVNSLTLRSGLIRIIDIVGIVLLTVLSIRFLVTIVDYMLENCWLKREENIAKKSSIKGMLRIVKIVIWCFGIIFLLDNLGFKISTVIAGLGIGGIAVALAAQTILGDLFSYFTIFFDRPFEIGDFIIIGDYLGVVEHVGIKTTRVRSLSGEQLVFSNTDLTNSRVRNYKRMEKRRVLFKFGVTYQTSLAQLKEIPTIVKNIIENINGATFDRAHFFSYGDSSLVFEVVYYVISGDYNKYMDIQQDINFAIKEEFEKRDLEFAYPTQTLYLNKMIEDEKN